MPISPFAYSKILQINVQTFQYLYKKITNNSCEIITVFLILQNLLLSVPWSPGFIDGEGLFTAWVSVLGYATLNKMSFGKEIIFTYGPYHFLFTGIFLPGFYPFSLLPSILLVVIKLGLILRLTSIIRQKFLVLILLFIFGAYSLGESFYFSFIFLFVLYYYLVHARINHFPMSKNIFDLSGNLFLYLTAASLSLVSLIKFTFFPITALIMLIIGLDQGLRKNVFPWIPIVYLISIDICWILSGQSINDLHSYILNSFEIANGYSEAMSIIGPSYQIFAFLLVSSLLLFVLTQVFFDFYLFWSIPPIFLSFAFVFMLFKASFVRQDIWHVQIGFSILAPLLIIAFFSLVGLAR
ncbi:hypothetical protein DO97_14025 [Neosynechococcus sphagnicola sy1]|uniref:Glycosyltransferase RgtA/B/C/D-like domain-containing protein n=1 Tax=Neosynechococcus sphagnicola sy1 TaxID=1497020 RepID=A0A098TM72_9CYAN|nr:hypothetical protein [Neosynechococcus sphagnicola]KGF71938.1 hypothetical protein DO97_14025 [Neosynechococcus sphagnicola sy1]